MLGDNIKRIRLIKNITENDLSKLVGITEQEVLDIENGLTQPCEDLIKKIAEALNTKVSVLHDNTIFVICDRTKRRKAFDIVTRALAVVFSLCACILFFIPNVSINLSIIFVCVSSLLLSLSMLPVQAKKHTFKDLS